MPVKETKEKRLHILTNSHCNNGCLFCSDLHKQNRAEFKNLKKYAQNDLKAMRGKIDRVLFSSGEPTLNPSLPDLIKLAMEYGYKKVDLITNGRKLADKKFCESLLRAGLNEISVSLHGSKKEVHDAITRVPGSFEETFLGLCNLSFFAKKYPFRFFVNFLLNKINYRDMENYLRLMLTFDGVEGIVFNTVLPEGRADRYFEQIVPRYSGVGKEVARVLKKFEKRLKNRRPEILILGLPPCVLPGAERNIIEYESAVRRKNAKSEAIKPTSVKWPKKIKGPECAECRFFDSCSGVWEAYVRRRGWKEFKPVKKI